MMQKSAWQELTSGRFIMSTLVVRIWHGTGSGFPPGVRIAFVFSFLVVLNAMCFAASALPGFPQPRLVQTHSNIFGAVIFWDATPYAERFASIGTQPKEALRAMEYEAMKIFVSRARALSRDERHLRVVVSITRTSAINARYQTARLEGVEALFTLDGKLNRNMRFPRDWESNARRGILPAGIKLEVLTDAASGK